MVSRANPCKGREAGCTADCEAGGRCANCRRLHNARETARRVERKARRRCTACGARAAKVGGQVLTTCQTHREYYAERARLASAAAAAPSNDTAPAQSGPQATPAPQRRTKR